MRTNEKKKTEQNRIRMNLSPSNELINHNGVNGPGHNFPFTHKSTATSAKINWIQLQFFYGDQFRFDDVNLIPLFNGNSIQFSDWNGLEMLTMCNLLSKFNWYVFRLLSAEQYESDCELWTTEREREE